VLGGRKWRELMTGQNGGTLYDRPKPTTGCSASGRRRRIFYVVDSLSKFLLFLVVEILF
jgi:hypothetical protein